jgi:hypothetical protein
MSVISDRILVVAEEYLGPGAKRFMERQAGHIEGVTFENLQPENVEEFAEWVGVSSKLLLDEKRAEEFSQKIKAILSVLTIRIKK